MESAGARPLVHLELHTPATKAACCFYEQLCGWPPEQIHTRFGSYLALGLGGAVGGGVVECPAGRPVWLPYVEVSEIHQMTARARELGARVMLAPREGPAGWRSVVGSSSAGEIALWQPKR